MRIGADNKWDLSPYSVDSEKRTDEAPASSISPCTSMTWIRGCGCSAHHLPNGAAQEGCFTHAGFTHDEHVRVNQRIKVAIDR